MKKRLPPLRMITIISIAAMSTLVQPAVLAEPSGDEAAAENAYKAYIRAWKTKDIAALQNLISGAIIDVTVFGTGQQTRCFCYVGDAVKAVLQLLGSPDAVGEVFNIGSDRELSIEKLARLVIGRLKSKSQVRFVPYDQAYEEGFEDMLRRVPALDKIETLTGWRPEMSIDTCIDLVARYQVLRDGSQAEESEPQKSIEPNISVHYQG